MDSPTNKDDATELRSEAGSRSSAAASLRPFFRPNAVAVVGASRDPQSIGYRLLEAIVRGGFPRAIYPINPKATSVQGLRAYGSVRDLPEPVDLAVIAVPPAAVAGVVDDCAARGVRGLVLITSGFAESGHQELQNQILAKIRANGMRLIGPNCLGVVSNDASGHLNATFVPVSLPPGRLAMSSDSGGVGLAVLATAARQGLGMSSCISVGNRADVSCHDLMEYWEEDDTTEVILLYLESFGDPRRFARIARRVSRGKPIVALKAGRTGAGSRAAGSHTAALAAPDAMVDALFHQTGVVRAETLEELFDLAAALGSQPLPRGSRIGIVTNSGGPGILSADTCETVGLTVPEFSKATRSRLAAFLPATASIGNPVDLIASGGPEDFGKAVETVLCSNEVDALIVIYLSAGVADSVSVVHSVEGAIISARQSGPPDRPVIFCLMPDVPELRFVGTGKTKFPCYPYPEAAARVLGKMAAYARWRERPVGKVPEFADFDRSACRAICIETLRSRGPGWLATAEIRKLLGFAGLPVVTGELAATVDEAVQAARKLGYPVAVKLASRTLVHKTELGGVHLKLLDDAMVRQAFAEIRDRLARSSRLDAMEGVLVQSMVTGGVELMTGVTRDAVFGPVVAFGLGGILVELLGDVCFRATPLTDQDAADMIRATRGYRLLQGYRSHAPADLPAIEEVLLRISALAEAVPEIAELDLNPLIALPDGQGCRIVDARIRVAPALG